MELVEMHTASSRELERPSSSIPLVQVSSDPEGRRPQGRAATVVPARLPGVGKAGPQMTSFHSALFHYNIEKMPKKFNSWLSQLAYGKLVSVYVVLQNYP